MEFLAGVVTGIIIGGAISVIAVAVMIAHITKPRLVKNEINTEGGGWHGTAKNRARKVHDPLF